MSPYFPKLFAPSHKIPNQVEELYTVHQEVELTLTRAPYPPLSALEPRLQFAYRLFASIPDKISEAAREQASSPQGGY